MKTKLNQFINVEIVDYPKQFELEIKKKCLIKNLKKGKMFKVSVIQ